MPKKFRKNPRGNPYATSTHRSRDTAAGYGRGMAVVIETTIRAVAGRHYYRAGKLQALLSADDRLAGVLVSVVTAMVVVP